ncbi:MAG: N-acetylmuramoyl-L-alanine amidase [Deltaproteobacteria bacterium]|nr:N-acetylmuramoyl-L-alanine amidase [Deltaproteobacteria bacterium]
MKNFCKRYIIVCFLSPLILAAISFITTPAAVAAKQIITNKSQKTIVVDPGHGGHDIGAKGLGNTMEKDVALRLALMLSEELGHKYKTALTRTDDYHIDLDGRTAVANHLKADVFISIHTGGSFLHDADGIVIFYFKEVKERPISRNLYSSGADNVWHHLQIRHIKASGLLAELIKKSIYEHKLYPKVIVKNRPLLILEGADTPAVLIETGYLTNPSEEKKFNNPNYLQGLVKCISMGIERFLIETSHAE